MNKCQSCGCEFDGKFCPQCGAAAVQQPAPKRNVAALVLAIIGAVCGIISAVMWAACADACADIIETSDMYTVGFIILGIGGAVVSLVGGIQAFAFRKGRVVLSWIGFVMQLANLILQCVFIEGFEFILSWGTLIAIILCLIAAILSIKKAE